MKTVIVLRGASSYGKTSTLNALIQSLEKSPHFSIVKSETHLNEYDRVVILNASATKVGIITVGDPGEETYVSEHLKEMYDNDVSIIIIASRTRGGVWNVINDFANNHDYEIIVSSPLHAYSSDDTNLHAVLNSAVASMLKELIESLS